MAHVEEQCNKTWTLAERRSSDEIGIIRSLALDWVAVNRLSLSDYTKETLPFTVYP